MKTARIFNRKWYFFALVAITMAFVYALSYVNQSQTRLPAKAQEVSGSEFQANSFTTSDQYGSASAVDSSGNYIVVWHSMMILILVLLIVWHYKKVTHHSHQDLDQ